MSLRKAIAELRDCLRRRPQPIKALSGAQLANVVGTLREYNERSRSAVLEYSRQPVPHGAIQLAVFNPESPEAPHFNHINIPSIDDMERLQKNSIKASFPNADVDALFASLDAPDGV